MRKLKLFIALLLVNVVTCIDSLNNTIDTEKSNDKVLSRKKRYLIFPAGSSFSVATCMVVGIYGNPQFSIMSWSLAYGFSYNLPTNASEYHESSVISSLNVLEKRSIETKPMIQRRYRRDLFNRLEIAMNHMGYDGRECVLRALCEVPQIFGKKGSHLIAELIRTIFSFPKSKVLPFEPAELRIYDEAHRKGKSAEAMCHRIYPNCGFSLINLALGKYSKLLQSYM